MAKVKDRAKPSIPPVAPGTYSAICVGSIDMGEQLVKYKDKSNYSNQVAFIFELVGEYIEVDGKQEPRTLSRKFTFSKSEKSGLRKFVESWQGKKFSNEEFGEFDTNDMVGKEAMIGVVLNDTGEYANIDTIMGLPKGMSAGKPQSELIRFDIDPWDQAAFDALPEFAQSWVMNSTNYQKQHAPETTVAVTPPASAAAQEECPI
ncbi:MAG: hypothetical protein SPD95_11765 [Candidatus Faecousia sp.]|nr:hypothetical protein [Candidatus Faecousia sp.]